MFDFAKWKQDVLCGSPPTIYPCGFDNFHIGPKRVFLIGGAPGDGKTSLMMCAGFNALYLNTNLRLVACNIEMPAEDLWERELARTSGVSLSKITDRTYRSSPDDVVKIKTAQERLEDVSSRITFVEPPFTLENVAKTVERHGGDIILLDYIQRITVRGETQDARSQNAEVMSMVRNFAHAGHALIVVAAIARHANSSGKQYVNTGIGSFRESSELEYGADECYVFEHDPDRDAYTGTKTLKNVKNRKFKTQDVSLRFNGSLQQWSVSKEVDDV